MRGRTTAPTLGELELPSNSPDRLPGTAPFASSGVRFFLASEPFADPEFHNAPERRLVTILNGRIEVTVGGGDARQGAPTDVFLFDDVAGEGHTFREVEGPLRMQIVAPAAGFRRARLALRSPPRGPAASSARLANLETPGRYGPRKTHAGGTMARMSHT